MLQCALAHATLQRSSSLSFAQRLRIAGAANCAALRDGVSKKIELFRQLVSVLVCETRNGVIFLIS